MPAGRCQLLLKGYAGYHRTDGPANAVWIKAAFLVEFLLAAMVNKIIGNAKAFHIGFVVVICHEFKYCTAEAP